MAALAKSQEPLHPDRLLPAEPGERAIARRLYDAVRDLPVISPHGHVDPRLLLDNEPFPDPATLFVTPGRYVTRLLASPCGRRPCGSASLEARGDGAWVCRNCRQVVSVRRFGAGGIFRALKTRRMVDALTRWPSFSSSPWIGWYPQPLFSVASRSISAAISALIGDRRVRCG